MFTLNSFKAFTQNGALLILVKDAGKGLGNGKVSDALHHYFKNFFIGTGHRKSNKHIIFWGNLVNKPHKAQIPKSRNPLNIFKENKPPELFFSFIKRFKIMINFSPLKKL